jgi:hypothetical protein
MKKVGLVLPLLLLFVIPMSGQVDHAATPEQCRADSAAWNIPEHFILDRNAFANLVNQHSNVNAKLLEARAAELEQCEQTDRLHAERYSLGAFAYSIVISQRRAHFMERHNLMAEFYQEDEAGKR